MVNFKISCLKLLKFELHMMTYIIYFIMYCTYQIPIMCIFNVLNKNFSCKKNCIKSYSEETINEIREDLFNMPEEKQDAYLYSLMEKYYVQDKGNYVGKFKARPITSHLYFAYHNGTRQAICRSGFSKLYGITRTRIDRVRMNFADEKVF